MICFSNYVVTFPTDVYHSIQVFHAYSERSCRDEMSDLKGIAINRGTKHEKSFSQNDEKFYSVEEGHQRTVNSIEFWTA